jgi:ATP-dependent Clp protease ATP-binding subunit ClpC
MTPSTEEPAVPKINVYLPDDLAAAVKAAKLPVSAVCQRALEDALRQSTAAAESTRSLDEAGPEGEDDAWASSVTTPRLRAAVEKGRERARARGAAMLGTADLLLGLLDQGSNLGILVIEALDVRRDDLRDEVEARLAQAGADDEGPPDTEVGSPGGMTATARKALELAGEEALRLGHNYLGCEHLLLGLIGEPDGLGGRVLRSFGLDRTVTRRTVVSALSGFGHAQRPKAAATAGAPNDDTMRQVLERLEAIERKLGA